VKFGNLVTAIHAVNAVREGARQYKASRSAPAVDDGVDRDRAPLQLERAHIDAERRHADQLLSVELRRQIVDWQLSRLRLVAVMAVAGWTVAVVLFVLRAATIPDVARVTFAAGWLLILGALAAAFSAQARVMAAMSDDRPSAAAPAGSGALWMLVAGLAATAAGLLF
jgi:hypothetical protein